MIPANVQSPIAPGISWYQASVGERPAYPALQGSTRCDVAIIGGGYTGLSAALHLAEMGADVVLVDANRFGDGASGRNGGQLGTGQREWADETEAKLGFERAKALFDLAEEAKSSLLALAAAHEIAMDYVEGHISVAHKARYVADYRAHAEAMARFGYPHLTFMDRAETAAKLGSDRYFCGVRDAKTGHVHPLKLLVGLARAAKKTGARLHEMTPVRRVTSANGVVTVETTGGTITANRCLMATNAYNDGLDRTTSAHVMPIRSFIGATVPLPDASPVLPARESVDDSRFVVRYFRKTLDNRLLFGGREAYTADNPGDISAHIRKQITEIYPALADVDITHAWGGSVGITVPRKPFVRDVQPGVTSIGGYSGHGVMLSNFCGKLYAEAVAGNRDRLQLFRDMKIPPFPGGLAMRKPLLFVALSWYAFLDRV
ncbi:MAG: FAD-binding oxidoreductase [Rhizobiaceae bacterium]|nr:FAD-binding oxidoreductase [Rhizobiaceae bacterium]